MLFILCLDSLCQFQHTSDENEKENKDEQENIDRTRGFAKVIMEKPVIEFQCEMCNFKTNHSGGLNRHKTLKHKKKSVNENTGNAIYIEKDTFREDETENDTDDEYANDPVTIY